MLKCYQRHQMADQNSPLSPSRKAELDDLYGWQLTTNYSEDTEYLIRINLAKIRRLRQQYSIPVIGITGANGKTITKAMLKSILADAGNILETPLKCDNAHVIGSTLLNLKPVHEYALIEFALGDEEQMKRAAEMTLPGIGLITNLGNAHLAYLKENTPAESKESAFVRQIPADGFLIVNQDDEMAANLAKISPTTNIVRYGLSRQADFFASQIRSHGAAGTTFRVNETFDVKMQINSISDIYNALASIAIARVLDVDFAVIIERLGRFELPEGRGKIYHLSNEALLIDDLYDQSVDSVRKAVQTLLGFRKTSKNLTLVLGDVHRFEGDKKEAMRSLGHYLSVFQFDRFVFIGPHSEELAESVKLIPHGKAVEAYPTFARAKIAISKLQQNGSTIMLKGDIGGTIDDVLPLFSA
jgi:UDP-N-acetylmuramoyl-tripeptide--D-alanyl-D-alanine ligase